MFLPSNSDQETKQNKTKQNPIPKQIPIKEKTSEFNLRYEYDFSGLLQEIVGKILNERLAGFRVKKVLEEND